MNEPNDSILINGKYWVTGTDGCLHRADRVVPKQGSPDKPTLADPGHSGQAAELERHSGDGAVGPLQIQGGAAERFFIRVTSFRRRLLDEDNLAEKYHIDCLRYAGLLPSDAPGRTQIQTTQKKVGSKEQEFVRIEIYRESSVLKESA